MRVKASSAEVRVFPPVPLDAVPKELAKLQVSGRDLEDPETLPTVRPGHLQFVEPSKRYADVIIPQGGHNTIAIEMIVAKIHRRLRQGTA